MRFNNLTISARLGVLLGALVVVGAVMVGWAYSKTETMRDQIARGLDKSVPQPPRLSESELSLPRISFLGLHPLLSLPLRKE